MEQTNQNQQNNQQQFKCPGNCLQCLPAQRQYCASQHAYSNMLVLDKVMETLTTMQGQIEVMRGTVQELAAKIEAIQNSESTVFDPNGEVVEPELFQKEFAKE
jgi:hypothetical protein